MRVKGSDFPVYSSATGSGTLRDLNLLTAANTCDSVF